MTQALLTGSTTSPKDRFRSRSSTRTTARSSIEAKWKDIEIQTYRGLANQSTGRVNDGSTEEFEDLPMCNLNRD